MVRIPNGFSRTEFHFVPGLTAKFLTKSKQMNQVKSTNLTPNPALRVHKSLNDLSLQIRFRCIFCSCSKKRVPAVVFAISNSENALGKQQERCMISVYYISATHFFVSGGASGLIWQFETNFSCAPRTLFANSRKSNRFTSEHRIRTKCLRFHPYNPRPPPSIRSFSHDKRKIECNSNFVGDGAVKAKIKAIKSAALQLPPLRRLTFLIKSHFATGLEGRFFSSSSPSPNSWCW